MSGAVATAPGPTATPLEGAAGAVLDELRTFRVRLWAPVLLGLIMMFDSWDSIAIAYVMPSLREEWGLTPAAVGSLISAGYFGQFVGAIALGAIAEKFGRMPVFIAAVVVMAVLALGGAFSPSYQVLMGVRFFQGIAIGGALPVSITYINELAPTKTRGRYFALFQFLCMSGYAVCSLSSTVIIPQLGWRWLLGIGVAPLILLPLVVATLPESPRWLARAGKFDLVNKALAKLGGQTVSAEIAAMPAVAAPPPPRVPLTTIFQGQYTRRTTVIIALWFLTAFTNFGLVTWAPSIFVSVFKLPLELSLKLAAAPTVLFLVITPIIAMLLDRVGRRPLAMIGAAVCAIALLTLATFNTALPMGVMVALVICGQLASSAGSLILWPFTAENYPTLVRAVALGICSSTARAASMLTPLFVGVILSSGGSIRLVFGVFGLFAVTSLVLWFKATRETARVSLDSL
jgi:putative MFS transporter